MPFAVSLQLLPSSSNSRTGQQLAGTTPLCLAFPHAHQAMLVTQLIIGVGTFTMAQGVATCAIVKERSHA